MSKLAWALHWASRGFPVFPLLPNSKLPAFGDSWFDLSTTDADTIRAYWTDPVLKVELDYNIGCDCTDRVVVDIDVKAGKDGYNQYRQLGGSLDTLVVETPTGGLHAYFEGPDSANVNIARDIEIRSHHGYVVAPGSSIDGRFYTIRNDVPPAYIDLNIARLLHAPQERRDTGFVETEDTPAQIEAGIRYLQSAPVAIEGQRGDETTFITAARLVREMALSPYKAWELMAEHWNPRCSPPWDINELMGKVENAASYGTADLGALDPRTLFGGLSLANFAAAATVFEQAGLDWGNALHPHETRARPWLLDRMLMLGTVSLLLAPGSAGKSSLGLAIACFVALGLDFAGHKVFRPGKVFVYNGEDDIEEQSRRLQAVCLAYGFDYASVRNLIILADEESIDMRLAINGANRTPIENEMLVKQVIDKLSDPDIVLAVLDPLVDIHAVNEGESGDMNFVMRILKRVARHANVAVLAAHHTVKAGNAKQEERVGNMDISRGSSSIVFKARVAFTLLNASAQDVEDYGIAEGERHMWVRLDDAKMNLSLANDTPTWFRREGVKIASGDVVGVLRQMELKRSVQHMRIRVAEILATHFVESNTATAQVSVAVAIVKTHEPLWENKPDSFVRQQIEGFFATPLTINGGTIRVDRTDDKKPLVVWG